MCLYKLNQFISMRACAYKQKAQTLFCWYIEVFPYPASIHFTAILHGHCSAFSRCITCRDWKQSSNNIITTSSRRNLDASHCLQINDNMIWLLYESDSSCYQLMYRSNLHKSKSSAIGTIQHSICACIWVTFFPGLICLKIQPNLSSFMLLIEITCKTFFVRKTITTTRLVC